MYLSQQKEKWNKYDNCKKNNRNKNNLIIF